ncbi:MAG: hypothetical protein Q9227_002395 [Pyrenula ochraceoflavens]
MFYDLNVPVTGLDGDLGYNIIALTQNASKLPPNITPDFIPHPPERSSVPKSLKLLTRLTLTISDPSQNHRLSVFSPQFNLLALRPVNDRSFNLCCHSLECDLISLDLSQRLPFVLKFKTVASALQRGIRFEICYSPGLMGGGSENRRNLISGATALVRATRNRGIIISSEAKNALGVRAPWDIINLATVWGLQHGKGRDAIDEEARKVLALARMKRESFRGVVDFLQDQKHVEDDKSREVEGRNGLKRKASNAVDDVGEPRNSSFTEKSIPAHETKKRDRKGKAKG